jgi:transposase-like protein
MTAGAPLSAFSGFRFPGEVITVAVRWYLQCFVTALRVRAKEIPFGLRPVRAGS